MSASPPLANGQQPSVFNALGSYADRIKEQKAAAAVAAKAASSSGASASGTQNSPASRTSTTSASTPNTAPAGGKGRDAKSSSASRNTPAAASASQTQEDDGPWEKVQSARQRKPEEKRGSSSKNWRDRSHRDDRKEKHGHDSEKKSGSHSKSNKKGGSSSSAPPASSTAPEKASSKATPTTASSSKLAWSAIASGSQTAQVKATPSSSDSSNDDSTPKEVAQSQTALSSPTLNGSTPTPTASVPASISSPNPASDTASSSTAISKSGGGPDDESSWRSRPKAKAEEKVEEPKPPAPRQPAPPPAVNPWEVRKKNLTAAVTTTTSGAGESIKHHGSGQGANGVVHKPLTNGIAKTAPKKKTSTAASAVAPPPIHDANLWPDVAQAAEVAKAAEEKKDKSKEKDNLEGTSVVDDSTATGKKPKWKPIPAAELLAAADQAAEINRRQGRLDAKKRLAAKGEGEASVQAKGAKPRKGPAAAAPVETKKASIKPARDGSASETKPQSASQVQRDGSEAGSKIVPGSASAVAGSGEAVTNGDAEVEGVAGNTSLSRQTSRQSKQGTPQKAADNLPSSATGDAASQAPATTLQSQPMSGSTTAPLPQHSFNPAANANLPRPPRGRDGRASFNGRGRGFRSNSAIPHKGHVFGSPPAGVSGLPVDGSAFPRGFAGYQPFYPVNGFAQPAIYDPMQAQYGNLAAFRGAPPPPMPQTVVPNLDSTRFYVLGQVEYYFSMQNLAMDFFLRQQMDSEGWIDIAMIASFNRVKNITPDIAIVRECMTLSALLEVREEKVRLAGPGSQQWVLPNAKPSEFGPDPTSPSVGTTADESRDLSMGVPASVEASFTSSASTADDAATTNNAPAQPPRAFVAADVENALMKSSVPASSTASVLNGDEKTEAVTPATSMSGDGVKEEDEEKIKVELR
ncbi:hypothetical protein CI109_105941 [Kwoniella shandongensis]|uniref:Uncharacterized protein n=1 Tax=Kwoniella shandongensis TaxID=1734106 RepID=A0A5M6BZD4_9TREE|nr:uncharacterized protein CI109_004011 [Kwoniella shandongensis]KAA5527751.1 hypothetical protein CI109_004011 [Kwoniella shandongensis]